MGKAKPIISLLERDGRSAEVCNVVAREVTEKPELFPELAFGLWHVEAGVRSRAADAIEKVTANRPELLQPFKNEVLGLLPEAWPAAVRWHLAQMVPRLDLNSSERTHAMQLMEGYLGDESSIVRAFAMTSLAQLAAACDRDVRAQVTKKIRRMEKTGTPAVKARARKILAGAV
ncbi:MAG: hypothetical protein JO022_10765 [Acidobacteriaceae bacterium]|nr:hypothetical protein [Acidobacteriaceae bacterium]